MSATSADTDENTRPPAIVLSDVDKTHGEGADAAAVGVGASVSESATSNSSSIPKDGARSCAATSAEAHGRCPSGKWEGGSWREPAVPPTLWAVADTNSEIALRGLDVALWLLRITP